MGSELRRRIMRFFYDRKFRENITIRFAKPKISFRDRFSCPRSVSEFSSAIYYRSLLPDIGGYLRRDLYESRRGFLGVAMKLYELSRETRLTFSSFAFSLL